MSKNIEKGLFSSGFRLTDGGLGQIERVPLDPTP
jgi:hypothetical protein